MLFGAEIRSGLAAVHGGDDVAASAWFGRGLARWRGVPLEDFEGLLFEAERVGLTDLYLAGTAAFAAVRIRQGQSAAVVTDLGPLVASHPYHERLRAEFVLALGASGRQVEALAAYEHARSVLVEEFGVDPGPGCALRMTPCYATTSRLPARSPIPDVFSGRRHRFVRCCRSRTLGSAWRLPTQATKLVGRDGELAELTDLLGFAGVRLVTLTGPGRLGENPTRDRGGAATGG